MVKFVTDLDDNVIRTCEELIGKGDIQFTSREGDKLYFDEAWKYLGGRIETDSKPSGLWAHLYYNERGEFIFEGPSVW